MHMCYHVLNVWLMGVVNVNAMQFIVSLDRERLVPDETLETAVFETCLFMDILY